MVIRASAARMGAGGRRAARRTLTLVVACCALVVTSYAQGRPLIAWSSDRANPFLERNHEGNWDIYVMDDLGNGVRQVTDAKGDQQFPSWAPHGERMSFTHTLVGESGIYTMDSDGDDWTPLTKHPRGGILSSWSPAGDRIAFMSNRDDQPEIYVINVDGSGLQNLTLHGAFDTHPTWSRDGTQIAFASDRGSPPPPGRRIGKLAIYVMDADGGNVRAVAGTRWGGYSPTWSPDGRAIAYSSGSDIAIAPLNGGEERRLLRTPDAEEFPVWSPDGRQIAFARLVNNVGGIWVVDINGQNLRNLTNDEGIFHETPDWFDPSAPLLGSYAVDALGKLLAPWARLKTPGAARAAHAR